MIKGVEMNLMYAQHRGTQPQIGPIVYRLGHMVFIHKSRVRLPVGLQSRTRLLDMSSFIGQKGRRTGRLHVVVYGVMVTQLFLVQSF